MEGSATPPRPPHTHTHTQTHEKRIFFKEKNLSLFFSLTSFLSALSLLFSPFFSRRFALRPLSFSFWHSPLDRVGGGFAQLALDSKKKKKGTRHSITNDERRQLGRTARKKKKNEMKQRHRNETQQLGNKLGNNSVNVPGGTRWERRMIYFQRKFHVALDQLSWNQKLIVERI